MLDGDLLAAFLDLPPARQQVTAPSLIAVLPPPSARAPSVGRPQQTDAKVVGHTVLRLWLPDPCSYSTCVPSAWSAEEDPCRIPNLL